MQAATTFSSAVAGLSGGVMASAITALDDVAVSMEDVDSQLGDLLGMGMGYMKYVTLAITVIFAVFIAFSVFGILGALMMTFCDKYSCRYLVYFACCFLFLLGIFCFLLSFLFSIFVPLMYYTCDFLQYSVESGANFDGTFLII